MPECSIDGCDKAAYGKGYCRSHYERFRKHGDPLHIACVPKGEPLRWVHEVALHYTGDECLIWPFGNSGRGYATLRVDGRTVGAHRVLCELAHGAPPTPDHQAAHSCGKGYETCLSPVHLSWKTPAENMADKLIHGTHNRGERHGRAKLTEDDARKILSLKGKEKQRDLAEMFKVSLSSISNIQAGHTWTWLSEEASR
ncbi:hypothetical protein RJJ65_32305 [Rhizobium hidalgonense]|uniref:HNH nuclease domain-containing protein n=1 Tax=Rhizobium hidalgonense TaxID=1538159 RepID=A0AAJ2LN35_9HYPH|nr:hypothetical protein [Rhizobium hidalgonense]MDR9777242.1 hypothetical protein [Rhizobium hidalgonense]